MAFVITHACEGEKAGECIETCPVDCIVEGKKQMYIDPDVCIDCGACEAVCPVEAIYPEDEVPEDQQQYIQINRDFFKNRKSN